MATPLRVLLLEDHAADAELILLELHRAGFEADWQWARTRADYLAHLDGDLDVILADYDVAGFDAPQALRLLQERGLDIPFIVVTGSVGEEEAVACIKQGAADYLLKDRLARLGPAVLGALQEKRLRDEKRRAEEALRRRTAELETANRLAQRRLQELTAIHQAVRGLEQLLTPAALARETIRVLERTLDYEHGAVLLLDKDDERLIPFALSDQCRGEQFLEADMAYVASHDLRPGVGITGWVAKTGRSLRLGDVRQDPRYLALRDDIHSELCVPLRMGDDVIGVVNVETSKADAYTEADQRVLETVAAQIASAVTNARLYADVLERTRQLQALNQQLVQIQEEERRRLSRELHDEAGQTLTALTLSLELIQSELPAGLDDLAGKLDSAIDLADAIMERLRRLAQKLRPPALDAMGINLALEGLCRDFASHSGLVIDYLGTELADLPETADITLYRFLQEALTNVARHARATRVQVVLAASGDVVSLIVEDDGVGFDTRSVRSPGRLLTDTGLGLRGMRERLDLLGGWLELISTPGHGTRLAAHVLRKEAP